MPSFEEWTCDDVGVWLEQNGFHQYRNLFCNQHKIDGRALIELTEYDLRHPPLQIAVLGDIKRMIMCLRKLHDAVDKDTYQIVNDHAVYQRHSVNMCPDRLHCNRMIRSRSLGSWNEHVHIKPILEQNEKVEKKEQVFIKSKLDGEVWKTVIGFFYVFFVGLLTSFTMVIVHDRVPDMKKYPPLPDIFLDNVPYISWAFGMCEFTGILLALIWGTIMLFHRHRFILLRRFFALMGTVFLLRCVTMLITSLSVPGLHLKCSSQTYGDVWSQIQQAFQIWKGMGMSLQGVRTCGDYMYSGHTCMLTLLNFFVTEYTPHRFYYLHILTWVMNLFGIFFILAAHEHYSIDVFIAFYITSRLFLYYHTLANNRALMQRDGERTRIWFPLFSFFESRVDGIVPNEYEWPFQEFITKTLLYFKSYLTKKHIE